MFYIKKSCTQYPYCAENFLSTNSSKINLAYSDAHLGDLAKTSDDVLRTNDLKYLSKKTNSLTIVHYFGRDYIDVEHRNALEFYEANIFDNASEPLATFQSFVNQVTDKYRTIRDDIIKNYFKTDPKNICNFSVSQLDELIKMMEIGNSLKDLVESGLQLRGNTERNRLTHIDYYMTAYMNLDLIGFFPDSMNENDSFSNLLNDSKHSAYGSICKAFITNDNKCYYKSKLLFEYYGSKSKLIKTCKIKDISELENSLNSIIE